MSNGWLDRLGLHRPELRAWALYDWANSSFLTTIVAAVFPIYFATVAAAGMDPRTAEIRFANATTIAKVIVALLAPLLGAVADYAAVKKRMLAAFLALGVVSTSLMYFIHRGDWQFAAVLFILANVGAAGSFVFYDSLLPHIASTGEMDRVSSAGYAIGYLGGGLLLAVNAAWIQKPEWFGIAGADAAVRLSFASVAVWWLGFSIPLFRRVPEPPRRIEADESERGRVLVTAARRLGETLHELRGYRQAFLMLLAFVVYNDGIGTIQTMAAIYGTGIGIARGDLILALLITQFVGVPFAFLFGALAGRMGTKRAIFLALGMYTLISGLAYFMTTAWHFYVLAVMVATVQGGSQALGRSLFATMIPTHKSAEFFAFFSVFEKFAGIVGPALFALTIQTTGSSRLAILSVVGFFVVGGAILTFVDVEEGQRAARAADAGTRTLV
jgi:UMF1 family MFS transporter